MNIDDIKEDILDTLTSGNPELLMNASKGSLVYFAIFHDEDDLKEKRFLKQIKEEWPNYSDYIDCAKEIINDPNSEFNKYINNYKKFLETYNKMPELFKKFFTSAEIFMDNIGCQDYIEKYSEDFTDNAYDELDECIFNYSQYYTILRALGFDGPDDDTITSIHTEISYDDTLLITGSFRFCVYGGTKTKFEKVLRELENYKYSDAKFGSFIMNNVYQAGDTFGISMNAIKNTDSERWISADFEFNYKI